jgi:hypothetical protein
MSGAWGFARDFQSSILVGALARKGEKKYHGSGRRRLGGRRPSTPAAGRRSRVLLDEEARPRGFRPLGDAEFFRAGVKM